ncbi:MFS transporter [Brevibacillus brevis]|uniref:Probable nicotinic acid uptake protein n=1 Tax=Brevibacillus brevis (strain 47 / JCM 6285 / NBRC 100599) TaxID=358681 RepID=C0ZJR0_BREBN|nr:MFS transporter [Brevibacillus brevis]OUQ89246.1 MFS transporter [Brevibacillus brevis]UIO41470.1 MFS transporter [Brevibacillus brevis]WGV58995.1 MFS transporter [Brevibacillus brevis]WJQ80460.1 MFS transporter [Brevibacillus brevis]BAH45635.1 probable nicotinic acid uptake protein [Brevibacillus brevis NBRC 100599]
MSKPYKKVFWAAGFGWMFDAMDVALLSFIMVALRQEWGLTGEEAGLLGTGNLVGMAIGAIAGGYLADRIGRKPVFLLTLILFGLASFASAFATGFATMLLFRFLMGLGLGAELPVASTLVNEFAPPEKRGSTVVLLESFWAVGWIAAAVISYFIIPDYGWRVAVMIGALPIVYAWFARRSIPESPQFQKQAEKIPVGKLLTSHRTETITLWVVWFAIAFSYYGMFLWMPSVLVDKGFTMIKSFQYVLIMTLAQLPGYFAAAYLVEKWGRKWTLATFLFMTGVMAFAFGQSSGTMELLVTGAFLSFFNLGAWGALYAYTPENYPTPLRATGSGMASGVGRIGSIIAPYLVGYYSSHHYSYTFIFSMFTAVLIVGAIVLLMYGRETKVLANSGPRTGQV